MKSPPPPPSHARQPATDAQATVACLEAEDAYHQGEYTAAIALLRAAIDHYERTRNYPDLVGNLTNLGVLYNQINDSARSIECLQDALRLAHQHCGWLQVAHCHKILATIFNDNDDVNGADRENAHADARFARAAAGEFGPLRPEDSALLPKWRADCAVTSAIIENKRGAVTEADARIRDALDYYRSCALDSNELPYCLSVLADIQRQARRYADAIDTLVEAQGRYLQRGSMTHADDCALKLARLWWERTDLTLTSLERRTRVLDIAIPAILRLDRLRLQFASPPERANWTLRLRKEFTFVFEVADTADDASLIAQLMETVLNHGVYSSTYDTGPTVPASSGNPDPSAGPSPDASRGHTLATGAALLADPRLALTAAPPLAMPLLGQIALAEYGKSSVNGHPALVTW